MEGGENGVLSNKIYQSIKPEENMGLGCKREKNFPLAKGQDNTISLLCSHGH